MEEDNELAVDHGNTELIANEEIYGAQLIMHIKTIHFISQIDIAANLERAGKVFSKCVGHGCELRA